MCVPIVLTGQGNNLGRTPIALIFAKTGINDNIFGILFLFFARWRNKYKIQDIIIVNIKVRQPPSIFPFDGGGYFIGTVNIFIRISFFGTKEQRVLKDPTATAAEDVSARVQD